MRLFTISFIVSTIAAWFLVKASITDHDNAMSEPHELPERISLLGDSPLNEGPSISSPPDSFTSVQAIIEGIDTASPDELKRWLLFFLDSPKDWRDVNKLILTRLASYDPEDAMEFVGTREELRNYYGYPTVLVEWARADLSAALDALVESRIYVMSPLMSAANDEESEMIYQRLVEEGIDEASPRSFAEVFPAMAKHNPKQAAERLLDFYLRPNGYDMHEEMIKVLSEWYEQDREALSEWSLNQEDPRGSQLTRYLLTRVSTEMAGVDGLASTWGRLEEMERQAVLSQLPDLSQDIDDIIQWADEEIQSPGEHQQLMMSLMGNLQKSDQPERLSDIVLHLDENSDKQALAPAIKEASAGWALKDPDGFQKWMKSLEDPIIRAAAEEGLAVVQSNQATTKAIEDWENGTAVATSGTLSHGALKSIMDRAFEISGSYDPHAMIRQLPESWRPQALMIYTLGHSEEAPEEAVRFLEMQPESPERDQSLQLSLGYWAMKDPSQASEWVAELGDGESRELAIGNLANTWVRSDPIAAMAWMEDIPPSTARDQAVAQIVGVAARYYPIKAFALAQSITDHKMADAIVIEALNALARRDPELASDQLSSLDLAPELALQATQQIEQERKLHDSLSKASSE